MNFEMRLFGCGKFRWLAIEKFDRNLNEAEQRFFGQHKGVCLPCYLYEQQSQNSMNLLGAAILEPEISEAFDESVMRAARLQRRRASVQAWTPAFAGAAVACLAIVAALQMIAQSAAGPGSYRGAGTAIRIDEAAALPDLIIRSVETP